MALDYRTLQETAASQPRDADGYCPECGRPWRDPSPERPHPAVPVPWHAVFLAVVGLALAVTFGVRAARAYQTQRATQRDLAVLIVCLGGVSGDLTCPSVEDAEDWRRVDYANEDAARRQRDRALVATALGLLAVGVGLSGVARRRRRPGCPRPILAAAWGLGEFLIALTCLQVLALYADLVIVRLSLGWPPAWWEALDSITDQVSALLSIITGL
jgi:hypothetical protein